MAASKVASKTTSATVKPVTRVGRIDSDGNKVLINKNQEVTDVQYRRFASFIEQKSGIVLGEGKQYLVNSRLTSLLSKFNVGTVDDLINKAMEERPNNQIQDEVIDAMTTNETLWFRDTYPYVALETMILPELAKKGKYPVRIWSAACSSGQEPYSIAMVVQEQMSKMLHVDPKQTQIIGTDLSPEMLAHCKKGYYDVHALSRGLSAERKSKFFVKTAQPNMMAIDLSGAGIDPEDMSTYLIEKKVFTRQGSYTSKRFGDRYLRVSFSIAPEKVKIFAREFKLAVEALRTK